VKPEDLITFNVVEAIKEGSVDKASCEIGSNQARRYRCAVEEAAASS